MRPLWGAIRVALGQAAQWQEGAHGPPLTALRDLQGVDFGPHGEEYIEWDTRMIVCLALSFVSAALANAGGIGGGAVFVALFNLVLGLPLRNATALSQSMIAGGAIASICVNAFRVHPVIPNMPLIDLELCLIMLPVLMSSLTVGVLFNMVAPSWIIFVVLVAALLLLCYKTVVKGRQLWMKESADAEARRRERSSPRHSPIAAAALARGARDAEGDDKVRQPPLKRRGSVRARPVAVPAAPSNTGTSPTPMAQSAPSNCQGLAGPGSQSAGDGAERTSGGAQGQELLGGGAEGQPTRGSATSIGSFEVEAEQGRRSQAQAGASTSTSAAGLLRGAPSKWAQLSLVAQVVGLLATFLALQFVRSFETKRCSGAYWGVMATQLSLGVFATPLVLLSARSRAQRAAAAASGRSGAAQATPLLGGAAAGHLPPAAQVGPSGIDYHSPAVRKLLAMTCVAGVVAGLVGIGGGMVLGPVLLEMGTLPSVVSASTAVVVLSSSSAATTQFALNGLLPVQLALVFGGTCLVASLVGVTGVAYVVRRTGRQSVVVLALAIMMVSCTLVLVSAGSLNVAEDIREGHIGLADLCHPVA
ncbi:unnamed protein product [Pedinophyceae sp. YPF-701]|nr:unnamed protein product [Pedinophyceae sp. YPF-701]